MMMAVVVAVVMLLARFVFGLFVFMSFVACVKTAVAVRIVIAVGLDSAIRMDRIAGRSGYNSSEKQQDYASRPMEACSCVWLFISCSFAGKVCRMARSALHLYKLLRDFMPQCSHRCRLLRNSAPCRRSVMAVVEDFALTLYDVGIGVEHCGGFEIPFGRLFYHFCSFHNQIVLVGVARKLLRS